MAEVRDLDILKPEPVIFRLAGEEIDVSFVPTGMTFDIDEVTREIAELDTDKLSANDHEEIRKSFVLSVRLCATFCQWKHPTMTEEWFNENTTPAQVGELGEAIREALTRAYQGLDSKNLTATE